MPLVPDFHAGRTPPDLYHTYLMPAFEPWARMMVERLPPSGDVLDIASGTGLVSRLIAEHDAVGQVKAIDVAAPMIAKARALGGDPGGKIEFLEASALELPFADDSFDCAYCHQGLQFFPDKPKALSEAKRVLKPGAKAIYSVWCFADEGNAWFERLGEVVTDELGEGIVPFGPFSFGDTEKIRELAEGAGLAVESLAKELINVPFPDPRTSVLFDAAFLGRPAFDGQLQPALDLVDPETDVTLERIIARMQEATREFAQPDGSLIIPMASNLLIAEA